MIEVPLSNGNQNKSNGANGVHKEAKRGTTRTIRTELEKQKSNPYAPRASDFLSNISNFNIIESTLRGKYSDVMLSSSTILTITHYGGF